DIKRDDLKTVISWVELQEQIILINKVDSSIAKKAIQELKKISEIDALSFNVQGFKYLKEGVKVYDEKQKRSLTIKLYDDKNLNNNNYTFVRQFEISDGETKRIPDIVIFLNGLPISVIELKSPVANQNLEDAWKQNQSLKRFCPELYTYNLFDVISNRNDTKFGSITSHYNRYVRVLWNNDNSDNPIHYLFNKQFIHNVIKDLTFFDNQNETKYLAAPHQIAAIDKTMHKLITTQDNKGGLVWHTQGSGKSVTMLMLTRRILTQFPQSTIIVITDRNSLDRQLYKRFKQASEYLFSESESIDSREELVTKLKDKKNFGIYFITVQKFTQDAKLLSKRDDVFILVDEAHRSQNNIEGEKQIDEQAKEVIMKFGYARYMRDAFPNAKFVGFTGTPLLGIEKKTQAIFGTYNHTYSMNDSVRDGTTVPILYESRHIDLKLNEDELKRMDQYQQMYIDQLHDDDPNAQDKIDALLNSLKLKPILENPKIILTKTKDILEHLKRRAKTLHGKAFIVASTRQAAYEYYKAILQVEPDRKESTVLVMTHSNKDESDMTKTIVDKKDINNVAEEFKKPDSKYKIAIIVDMWLTGFDVPDLDVMYFDKMMKWHNLMQAIARVNRTYQESEDVKKESGLIVDYLGIWKNLSEALVEYANGKEKQYDIIPEDIAKEKTKLIDCIQAMEDNYIPGIQESYKLNSKELFDFIYKQVDVVLSLTKQEHEQFNKLAAKIRSAFKSSFTILEQYLSVVAKNIQIIKQVAAKKDIETDDLLSSTSKTIAEMIENALNSDESEVKVQSTVLNKDINKIAQILEEEAEQLKKTNPLVAVDKLTTAINSKIAELRKIRPVFSEKISERLRKIIEDMQEEVDVQRTIELLQELAKDVTNKTNEAPEFNDKNLQEFFEVLADDAFLSRNNNSQVLRQIAVDLMKAIKGKIKDKTQFKNQKFISSMTLELKKILKTKYNYPPKDSNQTSGLIIDKIKKSIEINPDYFLDKSNNLDNWITK
uniref:type I restriction endonuclease subunit R n=1 Tax=Spiroplasma endosymbiont of Amphibalanus improvisus TaxID=3066327 RepID=UPI00313CD52F